ncbi:MAG: GNAT family N-acyltransferase [Blastocatellia bacterium]
MNRLSFHQWNKLISYRHIVADGIGDNLLVIGYANRLLAGPKKTTAGTLMNRLEDLNSTSEALAVTEPARYPLFADALPQTEIHEGRYHLRFARTPEELDALLKLRFEVFNLELREGLDSSFLISRDLDEFDPSCHHLIVEDNANNRVVGTYRMQTGDMAASAKGFYTAAEFDLARFPANVLNSSVELGRACVAGDYRNTQVLFLLWKGLAAYVAHNRKRYLFGCCSITSQQPLDGLRVMGLLEQAGNIHPSLRSAPRPGFECVADAERRSRVSEASIPKLFRTYLRFGAKVCGPPAIDRRFKTIDFLVLFDVFEMDAQLRQMFFGV